MRSEIFILGQGLAGTILGWELEFAGIGFAIADRGHAGAATTAAAGIINPITGRRLVKRWRVDELFPVARAAYGRIEATLGLRLWHDRRVRRFYADDSERTAFERKAATGELAPFAGEHDARGFWIRPVAQIELSALLSASRQHWLEKGVLRPEALSLERALVDHALVIDCRGLATTREDAYSFIPWECSKGERLDLSIAGLEPDVILNRRHWVLPVGSNEAWVGATHDVGIVDATPTSEGRARLEDSARALIGPDFQVTGGRCGIRVALPDKLPVIGKHP